MLAVRELLGLEPVAGFYQPLGGGDLRARGVFLEGAAVGGSVVANDARTEERARRGTARGRRGEPWRSPPGCAPASWSRARARARATGAGTPGSAVLERR